VAGGSARRRRTAGPLQRNKRFRLHCHQSAEIDAFSGGTSHTERRRSRADPDEENAMPDSQRFRDVLAGDPLLLTPEEAAKLLSVGRTTVYALIKAGDLHPVHIGRSCRLSRTELERYVGRLEAPQAGRAHRSTPRRPATAYQDGLFEPDAENSR
jgi:excisionase family DNA binding protein